MSSPIFSFFGALTNDHYGGLVVVSPPFWLAGSRDVAQGIYPLRLARTAALRRTRLRVSPYLPRSACAGRATSAKKNAHKAVFSLIGERKRA